MRRLTSFIYLLLCASSASAQMVLGSFDDAGRELSLLNDGRWVLIEESEIRCRDFPQHNFCFEYALRFSEKPERAPIDVDLTAGRFFDGGVFAGRSWGQNTNAGTASKIMSEISSGFDISGDRIRLLSTEEGTIRKHMFYRFELLTDLENGPIWSTVTRVKDGSRVVEVGTHVFGEFWTVSSKMFEIRKDIHNRVIEKLPLDWVND